MRYRLFPSRLHRIAVSLLLGLFCSIAQGQRVYWQGPENPPESGASFSLRLIFDQCAPAGQTHVPKVEGLNLGTPSLANQYSMINFRIKQQSTLTYPAYTEQSGQITIPSFKVSTDKGDQTVMAFVLNIGSTASTSGRSALASSGLHPARTELWQDEVVDIEYVILVRPGISASVASQSGPGIEWNPPELVIEPWSNPEHAEVEVNGQTWTGVRYRTRFCARRAGTVSLPKAKQKLVIEQPDDAMGFFARTQRQTRTIESENPPVLTVKPLPSPAPSTFAGAVGKFTLESQFVPQQAAVGEPITWTLKLAGTGNWHAGWKLPPRTAPSGFRVIQPRETRDIPEEKVFEGTLVEDLVLVPSSEGGVPPLQSAFTYFDTELNSYRTLETPATQLEIRPGRVPAPTTTATERQHNSNLATPPPPTQALLRDPIPPHAEKYPPLFFPLAGMFLALGGLAGLWVGLAVRETRLQDPLAPRRLAREDLKAWHRNVATSHDPSGLPRQALFQWRHLAVKLSSSTNVEPSAEDIEACLSPEIGPELAAVWKDLWKETESALFGSDNRLTRDWLERASSAINQLPRPRIPLRRFFQARSWWPAVGLSLFFFALAQSPGDAAEASTAEASYRAGDFARAAELWEKEIRETPVRWSSRNNLALALWQKGEKELATAHWIAAKAVAPRDESVRWNLSLGAATLHVSLWEDSTPFTRAASHLSATEWQGGCWAGWCLITAGTAILLLHRYRLVGKTVKGWGNFLALTGLVATPFCWMALRSLGPLSNADAVVVASATELRSIPSEAEAQSTPLPLGTVAVAESRFLGWTRLRLHDGNRGWTRTKSIIPVYRNRP
jgi:tetratricopeptide (TPR) repeat protein